VYLSSNQDLFDYLLQLADALRSRGAIELSEAARCASAQTSNSTEFFGESRIALRRILSDGKAVLQPIEQADIEDVLRQLTAAINRWPQKS
jgi:hypothetical protein